MAKLIIKHEVMDKVEVKEYFDHIPRVGEQIMLWYQPWPEVKRVLHNLDGGEVIVEVN